MVIYVSDGCRLSPKRSESFCHYVTGVLPQMKSAGSDLTIRCWGVRGSIPTPDKNKLRVGGNTPCIALQYGSEPQVIIDAGTGLRLLGIDLSSTEDQPVEANILFSHFHWDHIQGLPFFGPIYSPHSRFKLYSALSAEKLEHILGSQMKSPYFPVSYSSVRAQFEYNQVGANGCEIGSLMIRPVQLNHPDGAWGYRVDSPAGSVIYVSDHEHGVAAIDEMIAREASGVTLLIYDAHFKPEEYPRFKGWGHSTWLEGTRLAQRAGADHLLLFHHSPFRKDQEFGTILKEARQEFRATELAREDRSIRLSGREYCILKSVVESVS
jgi:phosphoribosyl 1,2-cyclic phosphodiesterase